MVKAKTVHVCSECGAQAAKWVGKCGECNAWNTMEETVEAAASGKASRYSNWSGAVSKPVDLRAVPKESSQRRSTGLPELDRVLGGGLERGSVVLIGGDPGVGKSTLLMQILGALSASVPVLYVSGEESMHQVRMRKERLGFGEAEITGYPETEVERIIAHMQEFRPAVMVLDSIQTVFSSALNAAPGNVAQVKECAALLTKAAKSLDVTLLMVGHVTKGGELAGPKVLEHIVDAVLYFEGEANLQYRMIRATKNRFGSVNEMGVFAMGSNGLEEVSNPSSLFMTAHEHPVSGAATLGALEGNRPFLVEVQALVEDTVSPNPKRFAAGIDTNRLQMLLAVLAKNGPLNANDQNVYVKIVGGVRLTEPAADLPLLLAAYSSLRNKPLPTKLVSFGEVGLAGELRAVPNAHMRLREAAKLGFERAIVPVACKSDQLELVPGLDIRYVARVEQVINLLREMQGK